MLTWARDPLSIWLTSFSKAAAEEDSLQHTCLLANATGLHAALCKGMGHRLYMSHLIRFLFASAALVWWCTQQFFTRYK